MLRSVTGTLSVIVVHHKTPQVLAECLTRLARSAPDAQVVLVDTDPDPAVLERARTLHPGIEIAAAPNHSLAHAVNVGLARATAPWLAVMNADAYVEDDTFDRLLAAARAAPRAGVLGPLPRTPSGRRQDHGPLYHGHYLRLALRPGGSVAVPWLAGFLQLIRRQVIEDVGGYDASLRFYNEDLEFCLRARAAGWRCRLVDAPVLHLGGSSTPDAPAFLVEGLRGGYQLTRRYLPAPLRPLHRAALMAWGTVGSHLARRAERRSAFAAVASMARRGSFDDSPFGDTLQDHRNGDGLRP